MPRVTIFLNTCLSIFTP